MGKKIDSWNGVGLGTKYGIEPAMSHKMQIFKAGINFSSPSNSCQSVCVLEMFLSTGGYPSPQHMTMTILLSSIPSNGNGASKNQFHNGFDFSHGIDSWDP
jgi:hypothetical protein